LVVVAAAAGFINACTLLHDFAGGRPASIPLGDYSYAIDDVENQILRHMRKLDLPSVLVAMIDDQSVVWHKAIGFADLEKNLPATLDTVYKIGSITKVFAGIEIMRLYEEGLLDLDVPITAYLPSFRINSAEPSADPITIRSMLAHRSGLPRNSSFLDWHWEVIPNTLQRQAESVADLHQAFPPGYRYKYSNIAYNVLGRTIEVIRGIEPPAPTASAALPYYMENALLIPIGMVNTGLGSRALLYGETRGGNAAGPASAVGYYHHGGKNVAYDQYDIIELASGNMHST